MDHEQFDFSSTSNSFLVRLKKNPATHADNAAARALINAMNTADLSRDVAQHTAWGDGLDDLHAAQIGK